MFARITTLVEDRWGRLWAGTAGAGVFFWDAEARWHKLAPEGVLAQLDCGCIALDGDDALWVGAELGELVQLRRRPVTILHLPAAADKNIVRNACATRDGSIWVGTDGAGVFRYRDGQFTQYGKEQGLANSHIGVILEDNSTNLWVGTWNGLFRLRGEGFERVAGPPALNGVVLTLCEDRHGGMWAGTSAGVVFLGPSGTKVYGPAEGVDHSYIRGITQDQQGRIWLAITDAGLYVLNNGHFARYGKERWPGETVIRSLHADTDSGLWIGTFGAGLARLKDDRWTRWTVSDGLPGDILMAIAEDRQGNLWFSSDDGIFGCPKARLDAYQPGVSPRLLFWHLSVAEGLETRRCGGAGQPVIGRSADGRLWVPNWRALAEFDPSQLPSTWSMWPVMIEGMLADGKSQAFGRSREVRVSSSVRSYEIRYTSPNLRAPERVRFRYRLKGYDPGWVEADQQRAAHYSRLPPGEYEFHVMAGGNRL
jgi:ligand-binding sensor domain-containing protein